MRRNFAHKPKYRDEDCRWALEQQSRRWVITYPEPAPAPADRSEQADVVAKLLEARAVSLLRWNPPAVQRVIDSKPR